MRGRLCFIIFFMVVLLGFAQLGLCLSDSGIFPLA